MARPNILFAIADDASHFGVYGHEMVHTPTIDEIAKEGVVFRNAFTTNPKCAPSRASILTGKHTWQLQSGCTHFCEFPLGHPLYPDLLDACGYYTGYTGKGWAPGTYDGLPRNPAGNAYNEITLTPPEGSGICNVDYAANFKAFLSEKPTDAPFYFWYGCQEPHRAYIQGEGERYGKQKENVAVPAYLPDCEVVRSDFCDYAFEIDWFDQQLGKMIAHLKEIGEYENTLIVVTSDNGCPFPRVKGQMYEEDIRLPLVMVWKNKVLGGRWVDDLVSFIDFAPTFLEVAETKIPTEFSGKSLGDILFSAKDGFVNPARNRAFMGRERHDLGRVHNWGYPVRCIRTPQYLYVHNYKPELYPAGNPETGYKNCDESPTKQEILFRHAVNDNIYYNLSFGLRKGEELFDIVKDPACMHNLAYLEEFSQIKAALLKELTIELLKTDDPRAYGKGDIFDQYRYVKEPAPPHDWNRLDEHYETWLREQNL